MAVQTMNEIMQQVATLTSSLSSNEKRALAAFLIAQAKQDAANDSALLPSNGAPQKQEAIEEPDPYRRCELEWLKQHDKEYAGQYIALLGDRLVAHAETIKELDQMVKAAGVQRATVTRIPAQGEILFGGW